MPTEQSYHKDLFESILKSVMMRLDLAENLTSRILAAKQIDAALFSAILAAVNGRIILARDVMHIAFREQKRAGLDPDDAWFRDDRRRTKEALVKDASYFGYST